jgi:hypothetical protein
MLRTMAGSSEVVMDILAMTKTLDVCLTLLDRAPPDSKIAYLAAVCLHDFAARGAPSRCVRAAAGSACLGLHARRPPCMKPGMPARCQLSSPSASCSILGGMPGGKKP